MMTRRKDFFNHSGLSLGLTGRRLWVGERPKRYRLTKKLTKRTRKEKYMRMQLTKLSMMRKSEERKVERQCWKQKYITVSPANIWEIWRMVMKRGTKEDILTVNPQGLVIRK